MNENLPILTHDIQDVSMQLAVGFLLRERPVVALASVAAAVVHVPPPQHRPHNSISPSP